MYKVCKIIEGIIRHFKIIAKKIYYKIKYRNNLIIEKNVSFRKGFIINMTPKAKLIIGEGSFFNNYCTINVHEYIKIGKNNEFGEGVKIYDHNHIFNDKSIDMKHSFKTNQVLIGDNNWIGSNCVILSKAVIGSNNVFSAGSIINQTFSNENIIKYDQNFKIEKIKYKE